MDDSITIITESVYRDSDNVVNPAPSKNPAPLNNPSPLHNPALSKNGFF